MKVQVFVCHHTRGNYSITDSGYGYSGVYLFPVKVHDMYKMIPIINSKRKVELLASRPLAEGMGIFSESSFTAPLGIGDLGLGDSKLLPWFFSPSVSQPSKIFCNVVSILIS